MTGERIAALEAVGAEKEKDRGNGLEADRSEDRESGAPETQKQDRAREADMERSRGQKGVDRDLVL